MATDGRSYADGLTKGFVFAIEESNSKISKLLGLIISECESESYLGEEGTAVLIDGMLKSYFHSKQTGLPDRGAFWMAKDIIWLINVSGGPFQGHKAEIYPALLHLSKRMCECLHESPHEGRLAEDSMNVIVSMVWEIYENSPGSATRLMDIAGEKILGLEAYKIFLNMKKNCPPEGEWLIEAFENGRDRRDQKLNEANNAIIANAGKIEEAKQALAEALVGCDLSDEGSIGRCKKLVSDLIGFCDGDPKPAILIVQDTRPDCEGMLDDYCDKPVAGKKAE